MLVVISGGSGSGKSAYAEDYLSGLAKKGTKYYIATMKVHDGEGRKKVRKHREMRREKGFVTIEQSHNIEKAVIKMGCGDDPIGNMESSALLECISNLTANEMFVGERINSSTMVSAKIIKGVKELYQDLKHLVIVTNNVFEDGMQYDESTMEYIHAMGSINQALAGMADEVIEVVVGIPLVVKERTM